MKTFVINFIAIFVFLFFAFFSCDVGEEGEEIDFNIETTLERSLQVDVLSTDEMTTFIVLDAASDPEISKYAERIKNYDVSALYFAIENYQSSIDDEIYLDGSVGFSGLDGEKATSSCPISPLNVTTVAGTGNFSVTKCTALANDIAAAFLENDGVKIYLTGEFSDAPLKFDLKVIVDVIVTATL